MYIEYIRYGSTINDIYNISRKSNFTQIIFINKIIRRIGIRETNQLYLTEIN